MIELARIHALPDGIRALVAESEREGFAFLTRLVQEWESGANRFSQPGEALFAACSGDRLAGVCGLNIDPFAGSPRVCRVRHLFVAREFRRQGIGEALLQAAIDHAVQHGFTEAHLRTDTPDAARFYAQRGFSPSKASSSTHVLQFCPAR